MVRQAQNLGFDWFGEKGLEIWTQALKDMM